MFNYGGYPSQPVVFIPSPAAAPAPQALDIDGITRTIAGLEALKKVMKEEKKEEKKDDKKSGGDPKIINMMLLMILVSPITGPIMSKFFTWGLGMLPNVPH